MFRLRPEFAVEPGIDARWDKPRMTALVRSIVQRELPTRKYALDLHLVSDATIRDLNAAHRATDAATDVLSFPLQDPREFVLPPAEAHAIHLGDVVVSYPRAVQQAEEYGHSVEREVAYLVAHGVLHILGYDHEDADEQRIMRHKEEEALAPLGFTR
jgi:probable rRNA maturation factor